MSEGTMNEKLGDDWDYNYQRFIGEALAQGCVWGLEGQEGWAVCPSHRNEQVAVMPLWSQPEFAELHAVDDWSNYQVVPIALEELLDEWLPGMHDDLLLVGPNWDSELQGDEFEPLDLLEDFEDAIG